MYFNRLEYIAETNQLMVNSLSNCTIIGLNIDSNERKINGVNNKECKNNIYIYKYSMNESN
ncbi:hypothetical protein HMPREF0880_02808 [Yokenella regensburgei ATCC 43003]|nr:hypothetical protein HMPREF0880_02808 [Yokenella regensburgei ATCC 43003]